MKLDWLDRTLSRASCYLILCLDEATFKAAMRHMNVKAADVPEFTSNWHSDATTHYFENRDTRRKTAVVCMKGFGGKDPVTVAALLVHEAVHIWQHHCDDTGESHPGSEQEAYAIQNIAQTLMESFVRQAK